jgi:hypothetical protein
MTTEKRRYNEQELREVLRRVQRVSDASSVAAADSAGLTRKEIVETAQELGYSANETTTAIAQYEEEKRLAHAEAELRQLSYRRVSGNFIAWTVANSVLWLTGLWASHPAWLIVGMGLWTLWLLLQLRGALFPHPDSLRLAAKKRLVDQEFTKSRREFTASVKAGTAKLLSMSAKRIDEKVEKLSDKP